MITNSILQARQRGASDEQILKQILLQNPEKKGVFQEAQNRGANSNKVLEEIIKQNPVTGLEKPEKKSFLQKTFGKEAREGSKKEILGGLSKAGKFLGFEPFGKTLGLTAFRHLTPEGRQLEKGVSKGTASQEELESYEDIYGDLPTSKQIAGSAALVGISALAPSAKRYSTPFVKGKRILGMAKYGELGTLFGVGHAATENKSSKEMIQQGVINGLLMMPLLPLGAAFMWGGTKIRGLPERLYSMIFKTTKDDLIKFYKTTAAGKKIDPTLAREVLDRGVMGSSEGMAVYSYQKIAVFENEVQKIISSKITANIKIPVVKKELVKILSSIKGGHKDALMTKEITRTTQLLKELQKTKGDFISPKLAIEIRRFIDNSRMLSSFKMNPNLSYKQGAYKMMADGLRKQLANKVPGLKNVLNEERIFIQAFDSITNDAVRTMNKDVVSLTDALLGGGGMMAGAPGVGMGAMFAVRAFKMPAPLTTIAQGMEKIMAPIEKAGISKAIPAITKRILPPSLSGLISPKERTLKEW